MKIIKCPDCNKIILSNSRKCLHCGYLLEKMTFEEIKSFTLRVFKNFKRFVNDQNISDFTFELIYDLTAGFGVHKYNPETGVHSILITENLHAIKKAAVPLLFHEFTHLWDYCKFGVHNLSDIASIQMYTEYHASEIQIMSSLGFDNINDSKSIKLSDNIIGLFKTQPLGDYIDENLTNYIKDLSNMKIYHNMPNFIKACSFLMYHLGLISILKKHSTDNISHLLGIERFAKILGNGVYEISQKFENIEPVSHDKLMELIKYQLEISKTFGL